MRGQIQVINVTRQGLAQLETAVRQYNPDVIIGPETLRGTSHVKGRIFCPLGSKVKMMNWILDQIPREQVRIHYLG